MWTAEDSKIFFHHRFCLAEVSLFCRRPEVASAPRAAAVKHGRRPSPEAARSVLDGGEHAASLDRAGASRGMRQRRLNHRPVHVIARQAARAIEDGELSVRVFVHAHGGADVVVTVLLGWYLQ